MRLKRKIELLEVGPRFVGRLAHFACQLKNKSNVTAAEVRAELSKMRDTCKKQFTDWFTKGGPELGETLVSKVSSRTQVCSVQDVVKLLMQGVDVEEAKVGGGNGLGL